MKKLILPIIVILVLATLVVVTAESINYDFDEVNVLYAVQFTAKPIDGTGYSNTGVANLIGEDKRLNVTYG